MGVSTSSTNLTYSHTPLRGRTVTPEEPIHVCFCSPDAYFAEVVGRALGTGFDLRISDRLDPGVAAAQEGWWDAVVLDLRDAQSSDSVEADLKQMAELKQVSLSPPIIVMLGEHDR